MTLKTLWCLFVFTSVSFAGSVEKIGKKGPIVLMESESEWSKGSHVCFLKDGKKKACGVVSKVKGLKALVKVKKSSLPKIKEGMAVKLSKSKKKISSLDTPLDTPLDKKKEMLAPQESKPILDKVNRVSLKPIKNRFSIYAGASYAPVTVFQSNNLQYNPPNPENKKDLWTGQAKVSKGAALMFAGMYGPFHGGLAYSLSGMIPSNNADLDFDINDPSKFVSLDSKRSYFGLFGDYLFPLQKSPVGVHVGAGLGYSSNKVEFTAIQKKDGSPDNNVMVSGSSSLSVISLRVPALARMELGPISLHLGAALSLGLMGTSKTSAAVTDPNAPDAAEGATIFSGALGHKKNTVGFDLFGGVGAAF